MKQKDTIKNKKAAKKTASKEKTSLGKKIFICLIVVIIIIILLSCSVFKINNIRVEGNEKLSAEEIISLSQIQKYTNIFRINKWQSIHHIEKNPYVENATISRNLPSEIVIQIEERKPTFMIQFADSYVYIDNQGYMLEIANEKLNVPILTGIKTDLSNIQAGNRMDVEDLEKMNTVLEIYRIASRNELADLITKIDISNSKNYVITLESEGKTVYLGNCSDLNIQFLYLKEILEREKGNTGEVFLNVDLNEQKVYFRPNS